MTTFCVLKLNRGNKSISDDNNDVETNQERINCGFKRYGCVLLCKNKKKLETCTKEIPIHAFTCPNLIRKLSRNPRKKTILQVFWDLAQAILAILDQLRQGVSIKFTS